MTTKKEEKKGVRVTPVDKDAAPQAARILSAAFNMAARPTEKDIINSIDADSPVTTFVATVDEEVVGVVRCMAYPDDPSFPDIYGIFQLAVDPAYRQRGIGHDLMRGVEGHIAQSTVGPYARVLLADETKVKNPTSVFYEKMGYRPDPPDPFPSRDDDGLLVLLKYVERKPERKAAPAPRPQAGQPSCVDGLH